MVTPKRDRERERERGGPQGGKAPRARPWATVPLWHWLMAPHQEEREPVGGAMHRPARARCPWPSRFNARAKAPPAHASPIAPLSLRGAADCCVCGVRGHVCAACVARGVSSLFVFGVMLCVGLGFACGAALGLGFPCLGFF